MKYASATFWEGLAERAISTFAQALAGALAVGTSLFDVNAKAAFGIAGMAALMSVLKSFSLPEETDRAVASAEADAYTPRHSTGQTGLAG